MSDMQSLMRGHMYPRKKSAVPAVPPQGDTPRSFMVLDDATGEPVLDSAGEHEQMSLRMDAVSTIQQWVEDDDDLDEGESAADRLLAMMVGIADDNKDGELDEDENEVVDEAREAAWDYLSALGVDEGDIGLLLDDWDEEAGDRIRDAVASALPDGEEAFDSIDDFAFEEDEQEAVFDAAYRKRTVVRNGKKKRVKKRVSGKVRLSGKQKLSIRKARKKAHNPRAKARRMKSMKKRRRMGK